MKNIILFVTYIFVFRYRFVALLDDRPGKIRLYLSISLTGPVALLGLSDNFTVARPFAVAALHTRKSI